jgi:hypothetical protein
MMPIKSSKKFLLRLLTKLTQIHTNLRSRRIYHLEVGHPDLPNWAERIEKYSDSVEVVTDGHLTEIPILHYFPMRWIYKLRGVTLEPLRGDVYSPTGQLVIESTNWHPYFPNPLRRKTRKRNSLPKLDSPYIFLASWAYFHFIVENLPLFLAARYEFPLAKVIIAKNSPRYLTQALELLGVDSVEVDSQVTVDELIICSVGSDTGWAHPKDVTILKEGFKPFIVAQQKRKYVYVARSHSMRSPVDENELIESLRALGVEIIFAEDLPLKEQISLFSSTEVLIGIHGAGLTNQLWMESGSTVIEIIDKQYFNICFEALAKVTGNIYESVIFDSNSSNPGIPVAKIIEKVIERQKNMG